MDQPFVRIVTAMCLAFLALHDFFATALTAAYHLGALGVAESLGRSTPGDDYRRLIPLMEAVPLWLHGLWVLAGGLYLAAIACLVGRPAWAYIPVLAAVGFEIAATTLGRPIVAATGVVAVPNPSVIASVIIPYVLPLGVALVLWWTGRQSPSPVAASG